MTDNHIHHLGVRLVLSGRATALDDLVHRSLGNFVANDQRREERRLEPGDLEHPLAGPQQSFIVHFILSYKRGSAVVPRLTYRPIVLRHLDDAPAVNRLLYSLPY